MHILSVVMMVFLVLDLVVCESISFFGCKCVSIYGLSFVKYNFI